MRLKYMLGVAAISLGLLCGFASEAAYADTTLTPSYVLKAQGLDMDNMRFVAISPDKHLLCAYSRLYPEKGSKRFINAVHIIPVERNGSLGKVRTYPIEGIPDVNQMNFTPDSEAVVLATRNGSTFIKVDCTTGETTTLMEHIPGQAGFILCPQIMTISDGKLLAQGCFYDKDDVTTRNSIVEIDANKVGVEAFTNASLLEHVQRALRVPGEKFNENFPRLDVGFLSIIYPEHCDLFSWDGDKGVTKFEVVRALHGAWGGNTRQIYSAQVEDGSNELCVYDAKDNVRYMIEEGRQKPYCNLFLSGNGTTGIFCDGDAESGRYVTYYARDKEGWKVTPIKGLEKRLMKGTARISYDGTMMVLKNPDGIRVIDLVPSDKP